jgi:hypothetical protein
MKVVMAANDTLERLWWKEPMVWLVAGLPIVAVIASFTTYYIAADKPDTLVNAGYHKEGMAPGKNTILDDRAVALSVSADLVVIDGNAKLKLNGQFQSPPASLQLLLLHPTQSDQDMVIPFKSVGMGQYAGVISANNVGKRQWVLMPIDNAWRLSGELMLPMTNVVRLTSDSSRNHP